MDIGRGVNGVVHLAKDGAGRPRPGRVPCRRWRVHGLAVACLLAVPACRHTEHDKTELSKSGRSELEAAFKAGPLLDPRCEALLPPEDPRLLTLAPAAPGQPPAVPAI